jgi:hypothetical protein
MGPPLRQAGEFPSPRRRQSFSVFAGFGFFCPLARQHRFDRLQHLILVLKLGCLKLREAGTELGSADVEAAARPFLPKPLS